MVGLTHTVELFAAIIAIYYLFKGAAHLFGSIRIGAAVTGATVALVLGVRFASGWVQALFAGPLPAPMPSRLAVLTTTVGYQSRATPPPSAVTVETSARVYLVSGIDPQLSVITGLVGPSVASVCDHLKPSIFQLYVTSSVTASIGRVAKDETLHVVLPAGAVAAPGTSLAGVDPLTAYTDDGYVGSVCAWQASDLVVIS
uniref:Uncharacterized protein n=1 Tax=mine drainage metagenome TaxID=410659 RepID=E6Q2T6_9ZZZZ